MSYINLPEDGYHDVNFIDRRDCADGLFSLAHRICNVSWEIFTSKSTFHCEENSIDSYQQEKLCSVYC